MIKRLLLVAGFVSAMFTRVCVRSAPEGATAARWPHGVCG
jgi:hypothetical protein